MTRLDLALTIPADALPAENASACFVAQGWRILVVRAAGVFHAIENRCPHLDLPLLGGRIRAGTIFCPHHGARFRLSDGAVLSLPATAPVRCFPCHPDGSGLTIALPQDR